jgi:DNA-directed RNA polymerase subunit N (RpoN/RPB10)
MKSTKKLIIATGMAALMIPAMSLANNSSNAEANNKSQGKGIGQEIHQAIEAKDFAKFSEIASQNSRGQKLLEKINADNFDKFIEMHESKKSGEIENAKKIAEELGIENFGGKKGKFMKKHHRKHGMMPFHSNNLLEAAQNDDFSAFSAQIASEAYSARLLEKINADNYAKFQEMLKAQQAAKKIAEELGLMPNKAGKSQK